MSPTPPAPPTVLRPARAWAGVGLTLAAVAALQEPLLRQGGLAPLLVAGVVGLALGLPAALHEARAQAPAGPLEQDLGAIALGAAGGAALACGALPHAGASTTAVLGWSLAALGLIVALTSPLRSTDPRRLRRASGRVGRLVPVAGAIAVAVAPVVALAGGVALVAPWASLTPTWSTWAAWLPGAVVLGLCLPLAGARVWSRPAEREPGAARAPLITTGAALLLATASWVAAALAFEAVAGAATERTPLVVATPLLAVPIGLALVVLRGGPPWRSIVALAAWTLWFRLAGAAAVGWTWGLLVPLALAAGLGAQARAARGAERGVAAAAAALATVAGVLGFPGLPEDPAEAFGAAATVVLLTWLVGWRRLGSEA